MKRKRGKQKVLTSKRRALFREIAKGKHKSLRQAAIAAGYAKASAGTSVAHAIRDAAEHWPEMLHRLGLTNESLIEKYLAPALEATETKLAQFKGRFTDSRECVAWAPRLTALDMAFKIAGAYSDGKGNDSGPSSISIQVVNLAGQSYVPSSPSSVRPAGGRTIDIPPVTVTPTVTGPGREPATPHTPEKGTPLASYNRHATHSPDPKSDSTDDYQLDINPS